MRRAAEGTCPAPTDSPGSQFSALDYLRLPMSLDPVLSTLRDQAQQLTPRAHAPFSDTPTTAVLLLDDGSWIPGVRVESASYSLTLPALLNAYTTAVAAGRADAVVAFVLSRPFRREEALYVEELAAGPYEAAADDAWLRGGWTGDGALPSPEDLLSPTLEGTVDASSDGIETARELAQEAHVPASGYAVGAVLDTPDGLVPGVNVEHPDWARILCAERSALGTMCSYALNPGAAMYLTCLHDDAGTPCGACRQWLVERAPATTLWMDRAAIPPERATPDDLLPGAFSGAALPQPTW